MTEEFFIWGERQIAVVNLGFGLRTVTIQGIPIRMFPSPYYQCRWAASIEIDGIIVRLSETGGSLQEMMDILYRWMTVKSERFRGAVLYGKMI